MKGLHEYRLKGDRNPLEKAFAEQWEQELSCRDLLRALMQVPCKKDDPEAMRGF